MIKGKAFQWVWALCLGVLTVFFAVAFLFWTLVPYLQMRIYLGYKNADSAGHVAPSDFIFSPFTYTQIFIRKDFLLSLIRRPARERNRPVFDKAIANMEELLRRSGFDPYNHVLLASAYALKAQMEHTPSFFEDAERHYKKSMEFSPRQQKLLYAYGAFLFDQHRDREAREMFKQALELDDRAPSSHFYFALALMRVGEDVYREALDHLEFFFASDDRKDFETDFPNPDPGWFRSKDAYGKLLHYFYDKKDTERVLKVVTRLAELDKIQATSYNFVVETIQRTGKIPVIQFK